MAMHRGKRRESKRLIPLSRLRKGQVEDGAKLFRIDRCCQQMPGSQGFCPEECGQPGFLVIRRHGTYFGVGRLVQDGP